MKIVDSLNEGVCAVYLDANMAPVYVGRGEVDQYMRSYDDCLEYTRIPGLNALLGYSNQETVRINGSKMVLGNILLIPLEEEKDGRMLDWLQRLVDRFSSYITCFPVGPFCFNGVEVPEED